MQVRGRASAEIAYWPSRLEFRQVSATKPSGDGHDSGLSRGDGPRGAREERRADTAAPDRTVKLLRRAFALWVVCLAYVGVRLVIAS